MPVLSLTCPTRLEVRPGAHATRTYRAISGTTRTRLFSSVPLNATISAEFSCTSAEAGQAMQDYHATFSGAEPIDLPAELFTGHEEVLAALPADLEWVFREEPRVTPLLGGRCTVAVELEGRRLA